MNRKEKFISVMKKKGFDKIVDLMTAVESIIEGDEEKGRQKALSCKNYSNMIAGTNNKDFSREYIIALEKVLGMRYIDMIDPHSENEISVIQDSLSSVAYANDYNKTKEFSLKTSYDEEVMFSCDEYGKYFIDYIIEFNSINCLRFLADLKDVKLNYNNTFSYGNIGFYSRDAVKLPYKVANLIYKFDDAELFKKIFNPYDSIQRMVFEHKNIYEDETFVKEILNTKKIFESILEKKEIDFDEVNGASNKSGKSGFFANPLINTLLKVAMNEPKKYEKQIKSMLNKGYFINKDIIANLIDFNEQFSVENNGIIKCNFMVYGLLVRYNYTLLPETPNNIRELILELEKGISELEYKESRMYDKILYKNKDGKVYLPASNNEIQYEMMKYMNEKQFKKIPIFYEHNIDKNIDIFEFKQPIDKTYYYSVNIDNNKIIEIAKFLKEFHKLSKEKLGELNVYLHNNLSIDNCSFKDDELDGVINWDHCSIGNPMDDILFVLVNWTHMYYTSIEYKEIVKSIFTFIDTYELEDNIKIGDELYNYLTNIINKLDKKSEYFENNYALYNYALIFIELRKDQLNERRR